MKNIQTTLKELTFSADYAEAVVRHSTCSVDIYLTDSAGQKGVFTEAPCGEAVSFWAKAQYARTIECSDGNIYTQEEEWYEITEEYADYFSMVITDIGEWTFYPTYKETEGEYRFDTLEYEEIEVRLLSA